MVVAGAGYILFSDPFGSPALGDRRTLADLSAKASAPGAVDGRQLFTAHCAACHQAGGGGLPGVFPPLDGSEWVNGKERVIANILLHGIEGEIDVKGTRYKGSMPSFAHLDDAQLAAVASYVRGSWSNQSAAIKSDTFAAERAAAPRNKPFEGGAALKALADAP
jgi:mono/diheme cytochrome c family protein